MIKTIGVDTLAEIHRRPGVSVIDSRPTAAFNGWRLLDETRGGHIPGAVAFPQSWAANTYDGLLAERLAAKGLTPDHSIVVYGYDGFDSTVLAGRLLALGYDDVARLEGGLPAWATREDLDMVCLPRHHQLVHPLWLHQLLEGERVVHAPEAAYAVFHVNYGVPEEYGRGHIPGAFHLDTNALESATDWNRRSADELTTALAELGITRDMTVFLYGRDTAADPAEQKPGRKAGQIAATRAAAILLYSGVEDVRLLDGGFNAWLAMGYETETETRLPTPTSDLRMNIPSRPDYFIDYDEAMDLIADPEGVLVSIRSWAENRGETSGYNYISQVGDIPGAVWGNCGTDAYHMQHYRNMDNTMRDFNEVTANWSEVGITPDKKVAFYCGTGWRASETFFYAHLMGWAKVSVYDGGWFEWSRRNGEST